MATGTTDLPSRPLPSAAHRPALDGLRAIAVAGVFLYHLRVPWAQGGFLGVDLFFVLSGYLITSLLLAERQRLGRIDIANFLSRRARRLLPALFVMLLAVAVLTRWLLPIRDWPSRQADLVWAIFYGANWHQIASDQDYFAQFSAAFPLRHVWSLSIEEQFYIGWPLLVILLTWRRGWVTTLAGLLAGIAASVVTMAWLFHFEGASRAYYGTDARAQELLAGALLAALVQFGALRRPAVVRAAGPVAVAALAGVLGCLVFTSDRFPGYYFGGALAFSLICAVLIWAVESGPATLVTRLLARPSLTWTGRVSYGLYLWHWPAIVFVPSAFAAVLGLRGTQVTSDPLLLGCWEVAITFGVAAISYYALELPIRSGALTPRLPARRLALAVPSVAVCTLLAVLLLLEVPTSALAQVAGPSSGWCRGGVVSCVARQGAPDRPTVVLAGDSIANSMLPTLVIYAKADDLTVVDAAHDGCSFIQRWIARDDITVVKGEWQYCYDLVPLTVKAIRAAHPSVIIATDRWLLFRSLADSGVVLEPGTPQHLEDTRRRLEDMARQLTAGGATLVLVHLLPIGLPDDCASTPVPPEYAAECAVRAGDDHLTPLYNKVFDEVAADLPSAVKTIDLSATVCPRGRCVPRIDGLWIRNDGLHFSTESAIWLEPALAARLSAAGVRP